MLFYVGSEMMPLISRVEHGQRVCVSHKSFINGLYSIILPRMHSSVLNQLYTQFCICFGQPCGHFQGGRVQG
jgi:hypothetical protein